MQKDIISGIYCIENSITGKKYIGQSRNINDRWYKHKSELNHNVHDNDYLQNAWNKYGEENFRFYILDQCDENDLDEKEKYYIELHDTLNREHGYNLKSGGQNGGAKASEYVRQKQSKALRESYQNNDDLRNKRKTDALEQWADPEIKEKIMGSNNGMYGKHHTEEARKKISEKHKGKISPHRIIVPIVCVELDQVFECPADAAKMFSLNSTNILHVCRGLRKTCGGYHWKFLLENNIS